jgi:dCMP deaminase
MPREITYGDIPEKMEAVYRMAMKSTDTSTKNGAIICRERWNIAGGFNHILEPFLADPRSHERPHKYLVTEHAERAAIFDAVGRGIDVRGATMVANWVACPDCARAIVLSGISDVVCHKQCMDRTPERWREQVDLGLEILEKHGVRVIQWSGKLGIKNFNNGEEWEA